MNYIEKIFKQYPFIYSVNDQFYIMGSYICQKIDEKYRKDILIIYNYYKSNRDLELTQKEASKIFRKVVNISNIVRIEVGMKMYPNDEFKKYNFSEEEIKEFEKQCKEYIAFFRKYHLEDYEY